MNLKVLITHEQRKTPIITAKFSKHLQYCSAVTLFYMHVHTWCHAAFHMENAINFCGNKKLHVSRHGILCGFDMRVSMTHVIYTTCNLAMEAFDENDYCHDKSQYSLVGKCIVVNHDVLSLILYFAGIRMPNKVDGKHAASNCREVPPSCIDINQG